MNNLIGILKQVVFSLENTTCCFCSIYPVSLVLSKIYMHIYITLVLKFIPNFADSP